MGRYKLRFMRQINNILKILSILFSSCLGLGFIVSVIEKAKGKKGWVDGHKPYGIYEKHIKRPLDFALSLFALVLGWPILLIIAITVGINMGTPIVFSQERPGLGGAIFTIKKYRTMNDSRDSEGNLLPDEKRLTRFGNILRKTSGDELLELFNILKGDMSLVGPRPLLKRYLPYYNDIEKHRHDVRPGLTGLAQVKGRNYVPWEERLLYDVKYAHHISFINDMSILFQTVYKVLGHEDVAVDVGKIGIGNFDEIRRDN